MKKIFLTFSLAFVAISIAWQWHVMWESLLVAIIMVASITATVAGTVAAIKARMALESLATALMCVGGVFGCIATGIYGLSVAKPILVYLAIVGFVFISSIATSIDDRPVN